MAEMKETEPIIERPRDALRWELEVHMAEYERVWRHVDFWNESRRTLLRYIVVGSAAGFGALVAAYDPSRCAKIQLLSIILLVIPLLFLCASITYLGHFRVVTVGGDYVRFHLGPRIREIIEALEQAGTTRADTMLQFEEKTGRRARTFLRSILRGAIGLGDVGMLTLPSLVSLGGYLYITGGPQVPWCSLQAALFWFDLVLTLGMAILVVRIGYEALSRVKPMDF